MKERKKLKEVKQTVKKKNKSKAKGSAFERTICKMLSLWISNNEHDDLFWRSAMSGGRATVRNKKGQKSTQGGDITAVHPLGNKLTDKFSIECKSYKNIHLQTSILNEMPKKASLVEFWEQTKRDAKIQNKLPMLIAKQPNMAVISCIDSTGLKMLSGDIVDIEYIYVSRMKMYILRFDEFINQCKLR